MINDPLLDRLISELQTEETSLPEGTELLEVFSEALEETLPKSGRRLADTLVDRSQKMHCDQRAIRYGFERRLYSIWREPLQYLEMVLVSCLELGSELNNELRSNVSQEHRWKLDALTRLHGRGCQIANEVAVLIKSGYADGAHARWRTLHELAVVTGLLSAGDANLSERYLLHEGIESWKAANQYLEHQDRLGLESLDEADLATLGTARDTLVERFGSSFKSQYGWASELLEKHSPTFADLEKEAGMGHFRPYYKLASHGVHAGPKSIYFNLALSDGAKDLILAGPSNSGLADPGHSAALSLFQITSSLVASYSSLERLISLKAIEVLVERTGDAFLEVQQAMESNVLEFKGIVSRAPRTSYWIDYLRCRIHQIVFKT